MERVAAHNAERVQHNQDQVAREKEALRNWQMAKPHESQRISEVIELGGQQGVRRRPRKCYPPRHGRARLPNWRALLSTARAC